MGPPIIERSCEIRMLLAQAQGDAQRSVWTSYFVLHTQVCYGVGLCTLASLAL